MALYESVFIARQDISSSQVDALADSLQKIIEDGGGQVSKRESWGLRSLAYKIKKNRKAHYVLFNIDSPSDAVHEFERNMKINEDILRYMTLRVDELDPEPSVVMQSRGRPERSDRGDRGDRGRRFEARPADSDKPEAAKTTEPKATEAGKPEAKAPEAKAPEAKAADEKVVKSAAKTDEPKTAKPASDKKPDKAEKAEAEDRDEKPAKKAASAKKDTAKKNDQEPASVKKAAATKKKGVQA